MVMTEGEETQGLTYTAGMKALLGLDRPCLEMAGFVLGYILSGKFLLLCCVCFLGKQVGL